MIAHPYCGWGFWGISSYSVASNSVLCTNDYFEKNPYNIIQYHSPIYSNKHTNSSMDIERT
jgi:hypothetical protein